MRLFRKILNSVKPHFLEGGKLEKMYPAYDAFETFLFVPDHTTKSGSHIRDSIDLKRTMITVVIALLPALFFGMWNIGYQHYEIALGIKDTPLLDSFMFGFWKMLPMILVSYGVGLGIEFAFASFRGHQVNEGYLVTGLLIPMIMPINVPLWMLAVSVIFAVVIGKEVFGGTGMNILNPALTARAFLFFAYPSYMSGDKVWVHGASVDGYSGETILGALASNTSSWDSLLWNASDAFYGIIPGSVGETSVIAIGIAAVIPTFQSRMSSNLPRSDHTYTLRSFCSWSSSEDPGERPEPKHHLPLHLWRGMPPEAFVTTDVSYPHTAHA